MQKHTKARIVELLADEKMTALQLTELLGVNHSTTTRALNALRKKDNKRIYIHDWKRPIGTPGGNQEAIYRVGDKKDKPRPKPDRAAELERYRIKWGRVSRLRKQAKAGPVNPFAQLMWGAQ
jgi:DNA-binding transcriptional ArsR family regulator